MTMTKLINNGYAHDWLKRSKQSRPISEKKLPEIRPGCVLKLPFIIDQFNNRARYLLKKKHEIAAHLVNYKGRTVQDLAKLQLKEPEPCKGRSCPAPGICHFTSVAYCATCKICSEFYIGMTTRHLHERAREHVNTAEQRSGASVFGDHYAKAHPGAAPLIEFSVVQHQRNDLRLHIEGA